MSKENVKRFYEKVSTDEELRAKLEAISRQYQGDKIDEDRAAQLLEKEILPLVDQLGFPFTVEELKEYEKEMQQSNAERALDDREMEAVAGGGRWLNFCFGLGYDAITGLPRGNTFCIFLGSQDCV